MTTLQDTPWSYEYLPYTAQDGTEIPNYRINDANGNPVAETNEDRPDAIQHTHARILATAPQLLDALDGLLHIFDKDLSEGVMWQDERIDRARAVYARAMAA